MPPSPPPPPPLPAPPPPTARRQQAEQAENKFVGEEEDSSPKKAQATDGQQRGDIFQRPTLLDWSDVQHTLELIDLAMGSIDPLYKPFVASAHEKLLALQSLLQTYESSSPTVVLCRRMNGCDEGSCSDRNMASSPERKPSASPHHANMRNPSPLYDSTTKGARLAHGRDNPGDRSRTHPPDLDASVDFDDFLCEDGAEDDGEESSDVLLLDEVVASPRGQTTQLIIAADDDDMNPNANATNTGKRVAQDPQYAQNSVDNGGAIGTRNLARWRRRNLHCEYLALLQSLVEVIKRTADLDALAETLGNGITGRAEPGSSAFSHRASLQPTSLLAEEAHTPPPPSTVSDYHTISDNSFFDHLHRQIDALDRTLSLCKGVPKKQPSPHIALAPRPTRKHTRLWLVAHGHFSSVTINDCPLSALSADLIDLKRHSRDFLLKELSFWSHTRLVHPAIINASESALLASLLSRDPSADSQKQQELDCAATSSRAFVTLDEAIHSERASREFPWLAPFKEEHTKRRVIAGIVDGMVYLHTHSTRAPIVLACTTALCPARILLVGEALQPKIILPCDENFSAMVPTYQLEEKSTGAARSARDGADTKENDDVLPAEDDPLQYYYLAYLAPELLRGPTLQHPSPNMMPKTKQDFSATQAITPLADVFSFGIIVLEMFSGQYTHNTIIRQLYTNNEKPETDDKDGNESADIAEEVLTQTCMLTRDNMHKYPVKRLLMSIKEGERPNITDQGLPHDLLILTTNCWSNFLSRRPTFQEIMHALKFVGDKLLWTEAARLSPGERALSTCEAHATDHAAEDANRHCRRYQAVTITSNADVAAALASRAAADPAVAVTILRHVHSLSRKGSKLEEKFAEGWTNCIPHVVRVMKAHAHVANVVAESADVIRLLCRSPSNRPFFFAEGILPFLTEALATYKDDWYIVSMLLLALHNIGLYLPASKLFQVEGVIDAICKTGRAYEHSAIITDLVCGILRNLACDDATFGYVTGNLSFYTRATQLHPCAEQALTSALAVLRNIAIESAETLRVANAFFSVHGFNYWIFYCKLLFERHAASSMVLMQLVGFISCIIDQVRPVQRVKVAIMVCEFAPSIMETLPHFNRLHGRIASFFISIASDREFNNSPHSAKLQKALSKSMMRFASTDAALVSSTLSCFCNFTLNQQCSTLRMCDVLYIMDLHQEKRIIVDRVCRIARNLVTHRPSAQREFVALGGPALALRGLEQHFYREDLHVQVSWLLKTIAREFMTAEFLTQDVRDRIRSIAIAGTAYHRDARFPPIAHAALRKQMAQTTISDYA